MTIKDLIEMLMLETGGTRAQVKEALTAKCVIEEIKSQVQWIKNGHNAVDSDL